MNQIIEVNGIEYEFPDDMPDDEISAIIRRDLEQNNPDALKHDFNAGNMLSNIPSSAMNQFDSLVETISHPIQSVKGVINAATGAARSVLPDAVLMDKGGEADQTFNAMKDYYKARYGGWQNFKRSMEEDPVGVVADIGTAATGAGAASRIPIVGGAARRIAQAGAAVDPLNIAINTAKLAPRGIGATGLPQWMYQNAFNTNAPVARTLMERKYHPTQKSYEKFQQDVEALRNKRLEAINANPETASWAQLHEETKNTLAKPDLDPDLIDHYKTMLDRAEKGINQNPEVAAINSKLTELNKAWDVFAPSVERAQKSLGDISLDLMLPAGVAYAGTQFLEPILPGATLFGVGASLGLGLQKFPSIKSRYGQAFHSMKDPMGGYVDNNLLTTMVHQSLREINEDQVQEQLPEAANFLR